MTDYRVFSTTHHNTWCDRFGDEANTDIVHRVEEHYPDLLHAVEYGEVSEVEAAELWEHWGGQLRAACRVAEIGYESSMECPPKADGDEIEEDVVRIEAFIVAHAERNAAYARI